MPKNMILITTMAVVLSLGMGFFAGQWYQKNQLRNPVGLPSGNQQMMQGRFTQGQNRNNNSQSGGQPQMFAQNLIRGTILSLGDGTLTLQLTGMEGTQIVLFGNDTQISRMTETDLSALAVGETIMIMGQENEGVLSAESIQVGNQFGQLGQ